MIISIELEGVVIRSTNLTFPIAGIRDFIESIKDTYEIHIYSRNFDQVDWYNAAFEFLETHDIHYDKLVCTICKSELHISKKSIQFDGDYDNLKYSILRHRKEIDKDVALSPGDYGKLYYRLSILPRSTTWTILKENGYTIKPMNKLVMIELALNILPAAAFKEIWKKEFRASTKSVHHDFSKAWNSIKPKRRHKGEIIHD